MKKNKIVIGVILLLAIVIASEHVYNKYLDYNFEKLLREKYTNLV